MPGLNSFTKLLLHFDGVDAGTAFIDSSLSPRRVAAVGNAQLDSAQANFGTSLLPLYGSGDYAEATYAADRLY